MHKEEMEVSYHQTLLNLRWQGDQAYHSLTATHLTANSIIFAAIFISIFSDAFQEKVLEAGRVSVEYFFFTSLVMILCLCGLMISCQMVRAQERYIHKNRYLEKYIEYIESRKDNEVFNLEPIFLHLRIADSPRTIFGRKASIWKKLRSPKRSEIDVSKILCDTCIKAIFYDGKNNAITQKNRIISSAVASQNLSYGPMWRVAIIFFFAYCLVCGGLTVYIIYNLHKMN